MAVDLVYKVIDPETATNVDLRIFYYDQSMSHNKYLLVSTVGIYTLKITKK